MTKAIGYPPKRKTLSIATPRNDPPVLTPSPAKGPATQPRKLRVPPREQAVYLVWREGGDLPKKIYRDPKQANADASVLASTTGERFHVLRSFRIYRPGKTKPVSSDDGKSLSDLVREEME